MVLGNVFPGHFYSMIQRSEFVCDVTRPEVASVRSTCPSLITTNSFMLQEEAMTLLVRIVLPNVYHLRGNNLRVDKGFHKPFQDD